MICLPDKASAKKGCFANIMRVKKYNYGLVLRGGTARGFSQMGVVKALEEFGMKPDIISPGHRFGNMEQKKIFRYLH